MNGSMLAIVMLLGISSILGGVASLMQGERLDKLEAKCFAASSQEKESTE